MVTAALAAPVRSRTLLVATGFAVAASLMYFAALFGIYLGERTQTLAETGSWIPNDANIQLTAPTMIFWTLLLSVATMQWAVHSIARDDRVHAYMAIGATLLFGAMVIIQSSFQFEQMGLAIDKSRAATLIYTIAGSHLLMLAGSMIFLLLVGFRALAGQYSSRQTDGIVAVAIYWDAMVFVYLVIWIAIFITK